VARASGLTAYMHGRQPSYDLTQLLNTLASYR